MGMAKKRFKKVKVLSGNKSRKVPKYPFEQQTVAADITVDIDDDEVQDLSQMDEVAQQQPQIRNLQEQLRQTTANFLKYQRGIIGGSFTGRDIFTSKQGHDDGKGPKDRPPAHTIFKRTIVNELESLLESGKRINGLLQHQMNMRSSLGKRGHDDFFAFAPFLSMFFTYCVYFF